MTLRTGCTSRPNANCAPTTDAAPAGYRQHDVDLWSRGVASVDVFSLLRKPALVKVAVPLRYGQVAWAEIKLVASQR